MKIPAVIPPAIASSIHELCAAYRGHTAAVDGFIATYNQPRFSKSECLTPWVEFHSAAAQVIIDLLRQLAPTTVLESDERAEVLIRWELECGRRPIEIAATAAELAA